MQELLGKIGRFCETHVEKIVLILVGGISAYLFFTRVIFSPNAVEYEQKHVSPSRIDSYVSEKVQDLRSALANLDQTPSQEEPLSLVDSVDGTPHPLLAEAFQSRPAPQDFMELFEKPLAFLETDSRVTGPVQRLANERKYALPRVGPVTDVAVGHIRAAAYVPVQPVTSTMPYATVLKEPNDIDLVTVEAKFDVQELYRQFKAYFDGTEVEKREWRDPTLAQPRFAAVQLERQERRADGSWGDWNEVPRAAVEQYASLLTPIENVEDLPPGGVPVRQMQFASTAMAIALLQPEGYQIASPDEDWLPPTFHEKYTTLRDKMEAEERRREVQERRDEMAAAADEDNTNPRRNTSDTTTGRTTNRAAGSRRGGVNGADNTAGNRRNTQRGRTRGDTADAGPRTAGREAVDARNANTGRNRNEATTTDEAYLDFAEVLIEDVDDLPDLDELLFWAFDDTAEPGKTYRYRIRLGVFNPIAGTDMLVARDMDKKDKAILWSDFSDVTSPVAIPKRLYFFAQSVQSRTSTATVEVARYALGRWYRENFQVRPGEVIGREMEPPALEEDEDTAANDRITGRTGTVGGLGSILTRDRNSPTVADEADETIPDMIDYRTYAMLVDLVEATDLGTPPNLQPRPYYDLLYTRDGENIEHMPTTQRLWPVELQDIYGQIPRRRANELPEPFRTFQAASRINSTGTRRR